MFYCRFFKIKFRIYGYVWNRVSGALPSSPMAYGDDGDANLSKLLTVVIYAEYEILQFQHLPSLDVIEGFTSLTTWHPSHMCMCKKFGFWDNTFITCGDDSRCWKLSKLSSVGVYATFAMTLVPHFLRDPILHSVFNNGDRGPAELPVGPSMVRSA